MKNRYEMGSWRVKVELEWKDKNGKEWKMKRKDGIYFRIEMKKWKKMRRLKWRNQSLRWEEQKGEFIFGMKG